jgi:hypothetical protein
MNFAAVPLHRHYRAGFGDFSLPHRARRAFLLNSTLPPASMHS